MKTLTLRNTPALGAGLATRLRGFGAGLARAGRRAQAARMVSVLAGLTDEQLAQAGIERKNIRAHVRKIMEEEDGGR